MFLANTLIAFINIAFTVFSLLILARIVVSWLNLDPYNQVVQFLHNTTEPILAPVRRVIPPMGMMDLSPMVVLIGAIFLERVLVALISSLFFF
jgi:YggT family protein